MAEEKTIQQNTASAQKEQDAEGRGLYGSARKGEQVPVGQEHQGGAVPERRQSGGLARYGRHPFALMQHLSDDVDRLFDTFFYGAPTGSMGRDFHAPTLWSPDVELCDEGKQLRVCVDLPGVPKDNVKIDIDEGRSEERRVGK